MKILFSAAWSLAKTDLVTYSRDRGAVVLGFLVPIALVTVFGWIFTYAFGGSGGMPQVSVWVIDHDQSETSKALIQGLRQSEMLSVEPKPDARQITEAELRQKIAAGDAHHGIVIPQGYADESQSETPVDLRLIRDPGRSMEDRIVRVGVMQATMNQGNGTSWQRGLRKTFRDQGMDQVQLDRLEASVKSFQATIQSLVDEDTVNPNTVAAVDDSTPPQQTSANQFDFMTQMVPMVEEDITPPSRSQMITYQQAQSVSGTSVMMLMFGLAGAGTILLAERERGILRRLFSLPIPRSSILLGKFMFICIIGFIQMMVLMVYSELLFHVGLFRDPITLLALVVSWVATAGSFGMLIATFSKSAKQGEGFATIIILISAALGGCWFPIQQMPNLPTVMELTCKSTMTYWAMSGFQGMLWNNLSILDSKMIFAVGILWLWTFLLIVASIFLFRRNYVAD